MPSDSLIDRGFSRFTTAYNASGFEFNANAARLIVCAFFIWKLLSRDYGFFGTLPEEVFYFYPYQIYSIKAGPILTGLPIIQELLTFHWVHWFLPHPGLMLMRVVQGLAIVSLICLAVFGCGPRKSILVVTYALLIYLWGYLFLLGQEIDAVDLYFGMLLALGISSYDDVPIWKLSELYHHRPSRDGGRSMSNLVLVFVFYYFASGIKKLTDIYPSEWFKYDLVGEIEQHTIRAAHSTLDTIYLFQYMHGLGFLSYIGPPLVYISHLLVPMVFFRRTLILKFFLFYCAFHLMTFGVGISFTGYIFVWAVLFPWRQIIARLAGSKDDNDLIGETP
ncbi:hypothetical protein [Rhizobium sp. SL42]|uniref:hypothetical protein n=1 Tax=Rhizobium sp. SL42 TaxID=2806346 RepID=UPI001F36AE5E|nr:hypothetical protein [Rhizobium sp. SL42]UJW76419.1 hypothetical protein IM739_08055 [Rhizobium sp. SL42]